MNWGSTLTFLPWMRTSTVSTRGYVMETFGCCHFHSSLKIRFTSAPAKVWNRPTWKRFDKMSSQRNNITVKNGETQNVHPQLGHWDSQYLILDFKKRNVAIWDHKTATAPCLVYICGPKTSKCSSKISFLSSEWMICYRFLFLLHN